MKKLLSLALSLLLLVSAVFVAPTTVSAKSQSPSKAFSELWSDLSLARVFTEIRFTEKDGPSANLVNIYLAVKDEFTKEYKLSYETEKYSCKVPAKKYEKAAFKYFQKSDKLLKRMRKSEDYSNGKYAYYLLGGGGGFDTLYTYGGYKSAGKNRYEIYIYGGTNYDENNHKNNYLYIPSKKDKLGKDYINFFYYNWDSIAETYLKITCGMKVVVSYNGKSDPKLLSCEDISKSKLMKAVSECNLKVDSATLSSTEYTYDGKVKKPKVTVVANDGYKLVENEDFFVTYPKGRKNVGSYKVKVCFNGIYSGTETLTFKINPRETKISKVTAGKDKLAVKVSKKKNQTSGYQIQGSSSKTFKNARTITLKGYKNINYTFKGLQSGKTYYLRVRTFKSVDGKRYYSDWSAPKAKKTK